MTAQPSLFARLLGLVTALRAPDVKPTRQEVDSALLNKLYADFDAKVDALVNGLERGTVSIGQFTGSMPTLIKQHHLAAAVIAAGGTENATPETYALAQRQVNEQLAYFERWKAELLAQAAAGEQPSAAYIANRAKLYGDAAKTTASDTSLAAKGLPPLPFHIGNGTQCRGHCKCRWSIRTLDVVNGNYDCYWLVDEVAEHCPVCVARGHVANPLKVRDGVVVDPERYQAGGLHV